MVDSASGEYIDEPNASRFRVSFFLLCHSFRSLVKLEVSSHHLETFYLHPLYQDLDQNRRSSQEICHHENPKIQKRPMLPGL